MRRGGDAERGAAADHDEHVVVQRELHGLAGPLEQRAVRRRRFPRIWMLGRLEAEEGVADGEDLPAPVLPRIRAGADPHVGAI